MDWPPYYYTLLGRRYNVDHVVFCLCIFVAVLLFATLYFLSLYNDANADLLALCKEAQRTAGFKGIGGAGKCF